MKQSLSDLTLSSIPSSPIGAFAPSSKCLTMNVQLSSRIICAARESHLSVYPPNYTKKNSDERTIQTFKDHLISGITSCDPDFPLHLWDCLLSQATLTLNLLRPSRINPQLSAEAQLNGAFNFNRTPLVPPGTKALIFESSADRHTWDPHGD